MRADPCNPWAVKFAGDLRNALDLGVGDDGMPRTRESWIDYALESLDNMYTLHTEGVEPATTFEELWSRWRPRSRRDPRRRRGLLLGR